MEDLNLDAAQVNTKMNDWAIIADAAAQSLTPKNYNALKNWLTTSGDWLTRKNINRGHTREINGLFISMDSHRECGDKDMVNERARTLIAYIHSSDLMPNRMHNTIHRDFDFEPPELVGKVSAVSINMLEDTGLARIGITFDYDNMHRTVNVDINPDNTNIFVDGDTVHIS